MKTERMTRHESVLTVTLSDSEVAEVLRQHFKVPGSKVDFHIKQGFLDEVTIVDTKVSFSGPTVIDNQPTGQDQGPVV